MTPRTAWLVFIASGVIVDLWRTRRCDGSTLSQATRDTFHTEHPLGRAAFLLVWGAVCAWFPAHILNTPDSRRAD